MRRLRLVLPKLSGEDVQEMIAQARADAVSLEFESLLFSKTVCRYNIAALQKRLELAEIEFPDAKGFTEVLQANAIPKQHRGTCVYLIASKGLAPFNRLWLGFRPGALPTRLLRRFAQLQAITVFAHLEGKYREYAKYSEEYLNCFEVAEYDEANRIAAPIVADYANEKDEDKRRLSQTLLAITDASDYRAAMKGCARLIYAREAFQRDEGGMIELLASRLRAVCQAAWKSKQKKIQQQVAAGEGIGD